MGLKFHWRLPQGGERAGASRAFQASLAETGLPDLAAQTDFCRAAESAGIDSLLTDFGWSKPDSILLAAALGMATERIKFIIAYRSGLICPTSFVQQLNTLSALINGRFSLNIVAGHSPEEQRFYGDFLTHDDRYDRTQEFLAICRAFWRSDGEVNFNGKHYCVESGKLNTPFVAPDRTFPELFIAGSSDAARRLAIGQGTCWMQLADAPERMETALRPILDAGVEVGIRCSIIARPTREEAIEAARSLVAGTEQGFNDRRREQRFVSNCDSVSMNARYEMADKEWLTETLWTGAVRSHGAAAIALVGSPLEIASALLDYRQIGVSQFILSGWPKLEEMLFFGHEILPLVRRGEAHSMITSSPDQEFRLRLPPPN